MEETGLEPLSQIWAQLWNQVVSYVPNVSAAIIILFIGWVAGRIFGKIVSRILDRIGVDDALRRTAVGRAVERSGISLVTLFDVITRWFVYLIAIYGAVLVLNIPQLAALFGTLVGYLPNLAAGIAILVAGIILADFLSDYIKSLSTEMRIEYGDVIALVVRVFLYFVVITMALAQMRIEVELLYIFATALAWGLAIGISVAIGIALGWGLKDIVAEWAKGLKKSS